MVTETKEYGINTIYIKNEPKKKVLEVFNYNLGKYDIEFKIKNDMTMNIPHDFEPTTIDFRSSFTDNTVVFVSKSDWDKVRNISDLKSNKQIMYAFLVTKENDNKTFNARISFNSSENIWLAYYDSIAISMYYEKNYIINKNSFNKFIDCLTAPEEYKDNFLFDMDEHLSKILNKKVLNGMINYNLKIHYTYINPFDKEVLVSILLKDSYRDKALCLLRTFTEPTSFKNMFFTILDEGLPKIKITKRDNIHVSDQILQLTALYHQLKNEVVKC